MDKKEFEELLEHIDLEQFISNAHTSQHRLFGYITTNIRSPQTIAIYIGNLIPEYISRKNEPAKWQSFVRETTEQNKQKYKRLEVAKILFRNIENSPSINQMGEKLYKIYDKCPNKKQPNYLTFILSLYLLMGRYYSVENQPAVEIEKILANYNGNIIKDGIEALNNNEFNRLLLACIFYNPESNQAMDISYGLIENDADYCNNIEILKNLINDENSLLFKRKQNAGGQKSFQYDVATILNYYIFKTTAINFFINGNENYNKFISLYIDKIFENELNVFFGLKSKEDKKNIKQILQDNDNQNILKDVLEYTTGVILDKYGKQKRKYLKQEVMKNYEYKCFFHCYSQDNNEKTMHELSYFKTKKNLIYLEAHHMIQMENAKFFNHDIDIVENIIPVCPICHRKLHNANNDIVYKMLKTYYQNADKKVLIQKGIFVDIETLARFYGIAEDK